MESSSSFVSVPEVLRDRPEWLNGSYARLHESFRQFAEMSVEDFRMYLVETELEKTCNLVRHPDFRLYQYGYSFANFMRYLDYLVQTLLEKRRDLLAVLMEIYLPFGSYTSSLVGRIKESDLEFFTLFLKQGHTLRELKGLIEGQIAKFGVIDVLDFFLSFEEKGEGEKVLHSDIVYHACFYENVDILDRVLVRGYPTNVPTREGSFLPIYAAIDDDTACLDRLIMYGVDVNLTRKKSLTPLMVAVRRGKINVVNRLVDVGARIENERDIPHLFYETFPSPAILLKLTEAGLDLAYRTSEGTLLEIVNRRIIYPLNRREKESCVELASFIEEFLAKREESKKE